jgi:hypothetical protein
MFDLIADILVGIFTAVLLMLGFAVIGGTAYGAMVLVFGSPKETQCTIQFLDNSEIQATSCDAYRDSTALDCSDKNYSLYNIKSWECK